MGLRIPWWGEEPVLTVVGGEGSPCLALNGGAAQPMTDDDGRPGRRSLAPKK
jgi:hypothetical protein